MGVGVGRWGSWWLGGAPTHVHMHTHTHMHMSSGVFRGKESSNRIELSQLVQDLLNFGDFSSLQLWGWGWIDGVGVVGGVVGGCPPHMCTCTHTHTCTCMHAW